MRFRDIPPFTRHATYHVNVGLDYLADHFARYVLVYNLDVNPDFQRAHVWTTDQRIRFLEYFLRGGTSGTDIYLNIPSWNRLAIGEAVLVDGKQRLDAAIGFLDNEFRVFGHFYREYTDRPSITQCSFRWHVNDLQTREEVLQWYLDLNTGGTVHSEEEITKVRKLLEDKVPYTQPSKEQLLLNANFGRPILEEKLLEHKAEKERLEKARAEAALRPPVPVKKTSKSTKRRR